MTSCRYDSTSTSHISSISFQNREIMSHVPKTSLQCQGLACPGQCSGFATYTRADPNTSLCRWWAQRAVAPSCLFKLSVAEPLTWGTATWHLLASSSSRSPNSKQGVFNLLFYQGAILPKNTASRIMFSNEIMWAYNSKYWCFIFWNSNF